MTSVIARGVAQMKATMIATPVVALVVASGRAWDALPFVLV